MIVLMYSMKWLTKSPDESLKIKTKLPKSGVGIDIFQ